jgi:phosphoribosylformylglycinamidine synthase
VIDLEVEAADATSAKAQVEKMCERLLANPLIESYEVEIVG